jgi:hypothetical protein
MGPLTGNQEKLPDVAGVTECHRTVGREWFKKVDDMSDRKKATKELSLLALGIAATIVLAQGQNSQPSKTRADATPPLIQNMAGEWNVTQRMWRGPDAQATDLPPAVAHRRLLGAAILQEQMEIAPEAKGDPFTRMSYFDYNAMTRQYEYFSIDSRAPQMMNERSYEGTTQHTADDQEAISLSGGIFVAPQWGDSKNAAFRYRIVIGPVTQNRQVVRLYLTPVSGDGGVEFLAFEYVYIHGW